MSIEIPPRRSPAGEPRDEEVSTRRGPPSSRTPCAGAQTASPSDGALGDPAARLRQIFQRPRDLRIPACTSTHGLWRMTPGTVQMLRSGWLALRSRSASSPAIFRVLARSRPPCMRFGRAEEMNATESSSGSGVQRCPWSSAATAPTPPCRRHPPRARCPPLPAGTMRLPARSVRAARAPARGGRPAAAHRRLGLPARGEDVAPSSPRVRGAG